MGAREEGLLLLLLYTPISLLVYTQMLHKVGKCVKVDSRNQMIGWVTVDFLHSDSGFLQGSFSVWNHPILQHLLLVYNLWVFMVSHCRFQGQDCAFYLLWHQYSKPQQINTAGTRVPSRLHYQPGCIFSLQIPTDHSPIFIMPWRLPRHIGPCK